jgi:hypothetical protein
VKAGDWAMLGDVVHSSTHKRLMCRCCAGKVVQLSFLRISTDGPHWHFMVPMFCRVFELSIASAPQHRVMSLCSPDHVRAYDTNTLLGKDGK